jgi:hypothetical protein
MPVFKLVNEDGVWLEDARLGGADWKPGDRIAQGRESLEVARCAPAGRCLCWLSVRPRCGRAGATRPYRS